VLESQSRLPNRSWARAIHISTGSGSGGVAAGDSTAIDITIEQVVNNQEVTLQAWTVQ